MVTGYYETIKTACTKIRKEETEKKFKTVMRKGINGPESQV